MFAKKIASVIIATLLALAGCTMLLKRSLDPSRPIPAPQPTLSVELRKELAAQELIKFCLVIAKDVVYYDMGTFVETAHKKLSVGDNTLMLITRDFPELKVPTTEILIVYERFVAAYKRRLGERGFSLQDPPGDSACLLLAFDFGKSETLNDARLEVTHLFARPRIFYRGKMILVARDDWYGGEIFGRKEPRESRWVVAVETTVNQAVEELFQVWELGIRKKK